MVSVMLFYDLPLQYARYNYDFTLHYNAIYYGYLMPYWLILSTPVTTASLIDGHPLIIYFHSTCNLGSSSPAAHVFHRCTFRGIY